MKRVLVLGAGLVTRPGVRYLLETAGVRVTVADLDAERAARLCGAHPNARALGLDVQDAPALRAAIRDSDVVISLLPYLLHGKVATVCLAEGKHLVTSSYVSDAMRALDAEARQKGLLFLNELGLDPGIDHMSAQKIIDEVKGQGGRVVSFDSYCGGLPAPEADTNPFGYKFSWSPRGVVLAARNKARYLARGQVVEVPNWEYFQAVRYLRVDGLGVLEAYPNRDSTGYVGVYGLEGIQDLYRGTLRYPGHCATWTAIVRSGMLDLDERVGMADRTYAEFICSLTGGEPATALLSFCRKTGLTPESDAVARLQWLGLFGDEKVGVDRISALDVLANRLAQKLQYSPGERDLVVLVHAFVVETQGRREAIRSQLVDFGIPGGDTAMARTVSLPAAIATRLLCEGKLSLTGVRIPVDREVYAPVLAELANMNIVVKESRQPL